MSTYIAKPEHQVAYEDILALVRKNADTLSALELLAVAANMLGKMVALQDQRTVSSALAMETVARNIKAGNMQVVEALRRETKWRA